MKKGFTLIELLAALTILALLALITVPTVSKQLNNSKVKIYKAQITNIKSAAQAWGADNVFKLPSEDCITITLGYLKDLGYIDVTVKNPNTNKEFSDTDTFVNISKKNNSFVYDVKTSGNKCKLVDEKIINQE